jgi:hypothetical protein
MLPEVDRHAMYMDFVSKRMVSLGTVTTVDRKLNKFKVDGIVYHGGTYMQAKAGVEEFLVKAWSAYNVQFWQPKAAKSGEFYCYFCTSAF